MSEQSFQLHDKTITIYGEWEKPVPVVYFHSFQKEGEQVWDECRRLSVPQFYLVEISGEGWNRDLSPWAAEALFPGEEKMEGGAPAWLPILTDEIIPQVEQRIQVTHRVIAGYSLAGLFAYWAIYNTSVFDSVISCSASFWYPDFMEYVKEHAFPRKPLTAYFSIGNKESKVKNAVMQTTEPNTRFLQHTLESEGIASVFELNNGNHFVQSEWRVAKGIQWTLRTLKRL